MARRPEEFQASGKDRSAGERSKRTEQQGDPHTFKGLCANCAKRRGCLLPEREGGVWHCEEYLEEE